MKLNKKPKYKVGDMVYGPFFIKKPMEVEAISEYCCTGLPLYRVSLNGRLTLYLLEKQMSKRPQKKENAETLTVPKPKYEVGQDVYVVTNNKKVRKCTIVGIKSYTRFGYSTDQDINYQLFNFDREEECESRWECQIFPTEEEAEASFMDKEETLTIQVKASRREIAKALENKEYELI